MKPCATLALFASLGLAAACGNGGSGDGMGLTGLPAEMAPAARETDGSWDSATITQRFESQQPVTSLDDPLFDLINEAYALVGRPLGEAEKVAIVGPARFRELQSVWGADLAGRDVGAFAVHSGGETGLVMPDTVPPAEFAETFWHEIGHTREAHLGEQEAELAEILDTIAVAQLEPAVALPLLERVLEVPDKTLSAESIYTTAHVLAMHLIANHEGDMEAARAELQAEGWDAEAAHAEMKTACGCDLPSLLPDYREFAESFGEALAKTQPLAAAVPGTLVSARAMLRVHLEMLVGLAGTAEGDQTSRARVVEIVDEYLAQPDPVAPIRAWLLEKGTVVARQAASSPSVSADDKYGFYADILGFHAGEEGEPSADYLNTYLDLLNLIHDPVAANMDAARVREVGDAWAARFGLETLPQEDMREAIFVLLLDRGLVEADPCDGKQWYEAAKALTAGCDDESCASFAHFDSWMPTLDGKLADVAAANCQ